MGKEAIEQKVWEIIDQYENKEISFEEAIDKYAELNNNDVDEVIADLEYMICGVLTTETKDQVKARVEELKKKEK